jgi:hypothetical protein
VTGKFKSLNTPTRTVTISPRTAEYGKNGRTKNGFETVNTLASASSSATPDTNKRKCQSCMGKQGGGIWERDYVPMPKEGWLENARNRQRVIVSGARKSSS